MSIKIFLENLLEQIFDQSTSFDPIPSENIYKYISKLIEYNHEFLLIFHNDQILSRDFKFENLGSNSTSFKLSYLKGEDYIKKHVKQTTVSRLQIFSSDSKGIQESQNLIGSHTFSSMKKETQNAIERIDQQIHQLQEKIVYLEQLKQQLINTNNNSSQINFAKSTSSGSMLIEQEYFCSFCLQPIQQQSVFATPCQHYFHIYCLEISIDSQLGVKNPVFVCICNKQLKLSILFNLIPNHILASLKQIQFLQNQLIVITDGFKCKMKFFSCQNGCGFNFILQEALQVDQPYCPSCLSFTKFQQLK